MFVRVTNARTGKMVTINPSMIGMVQDRDDPQYPTTKSVIIMNDGRNTFVPCLEDEEYISRQISGAAGGVANRGQSQAARDDREIPSNTNER